METVGGATEAHRYVQEEPGKVPEPTPKARTHAHDIMSFPQIHATEDTDAHFITKTTFIVKCDLAKINFNHVCLKLR